ncbi:hypothetical protein [Acrocarpospora sp. B8E8]|uniref:hypothetical protein n=1 Tax=Acrocarpospora sp. B8E8 TaxID=3153572 RepID=UPI00325CD4B9
MTEKRRNYYDRQSNAKPRRDGGLCVDGKEHVWQPLSFRFETQVLDERGRVEIRQPDLIDAHVYCLCWGCRSWTYVSADWVGFQLGGPEQVDPTLMTDDD